MTNNINIATTQKDWDDFFATQNTQEVDLGSNKQDWLDLYMTGEYSSGKEYEVKKETEKPKTTYKVPPPGYIFDR
jgi:hypothetical protein